MIYHIMVDDKFIDGFIEDAEKVSQPNTNVYFIRGDKNNPQHVTHPLAKWVDIWSEDFKIILDSITEQDKLLVHWYDLYVSRLILSINKKILLYVPLWGGDFYEEPYLHHIAWIHDPITLQFVIQKNVYPKKWSLRPWVFFRQVKDVYNYKKKSYSEYIIKKQTIERINHILIDPNNIGEIKLTKKIYGIDSLSFLPFHYNQNFDFANSIRKEAIKKDEKVNVLIGNSGTESNNHADCFKILKKFSKKNIVFTVPLSYGSADYIGFVMRKGKKTFKENFIPLESFIPREEYIAQLNNIDIGIMYHNRSQAFGNMITLLSLGKKLYLKSNNPLWELFKKTGIKVWDANNIKQMTFDEFSAPLSIFESESNIEKISKLFSEKKRLEYLSKVLN